MKQLLSPSVLANDDVVKFDATPSGLKGQNNKAQAPPWECSAWQATTIQPNGKPLHPRPLLKPSKKGVVQLQTTPPAHLQETRATVTGILAYASGWCGLQRECVTRHPKSQEIEPLPKKRTGSNTGNTPVRRPSATARRGSS